LVNIFNFLGYDWTVTDEWKFTWHDPKRYVVRCQCQRGKVKNKRYNARNNLTQTWLTFYTTQTQLHICFI
jgi:hypothetical protein